MLSPMSSGSSKFSAASLLTERIMMSLGPTNMRKYGHAKGSARHPAKGLINEKGRSPSINSEIVM